MTEFNAEINGTSSSLDLALDLQGESPPTALDILRSTGIESGTVAIIRDFEMNDLKKAERIDKPVGDFGAGGSWSARPSSPDPNFGIGGDWRSCSGGSEMGFFDFCQKYGGISGSDGDRAVAEGAPGDEIVSVSVAAAGGDDDDNGGFIDFQVNAPDSVSGSVSEDGDDDDEFYDASECLRIVIAPDNVSRSDDDDEFHDALAHSPYDPCVLE